MRLKENITGNECLYAKRRIVRYRKVANTRNTLMMTGLMIKYCSNPRWDTAHYDDMVDEFERLVNEPKTDG